MESGGEVFLIVMFMLGLWLVILPNTLVRLYVRLNQSSAPPRPILYRVIGAVICALAVHSFWQYFWR